MSPHRLLLVVSCGAITLAAGCGSGDDEPAAKQRPVSSTESTRAATPFDGEYRLTLTPAQARRIPDPSIRAGVYQLSLGDGSYSLISPQHGPYNRGSVAASGETLRFGRDVGEGCDRRGEYRVATAGGALKLAAVSDGCEGRKAFFDGRTWRRR